jgi:uncharacterized protein YqeY
MTLRDQIEEDIKSAMRGREQQRLEALRFLKSVIQLAEKDQGKSLDDDGLVQVIARQVNDRRESIRLFDEAHRADLVTKEAADLAVLEAYLPPQLSPEELTQLVHQVIVEVGATSARDKGKVMGRLMPQVRGKADGAEVNNLVTQILESAG